MRFPRLGTRLGATLVGMLLVGLIATAAPASAATNARASHLSGTTAVTTAPGVAGTLLRAGILPLPVPPTGLGISIRHGLAVTYRFPITGGNPDLAGPSGDIRHSGGINFISRRGHLEIGRFDIDLAAGKIFATQVNFAPARIPVLDLHLSGPKVTSRDHATVLTGIIVTLDPVAAGALNSTFGLTLPTDGSLRFGSAVITLRR